MAILQVANVSRCFRTSAGSVCALDNISLDIHQGEFVSIIGPSGCGKPSLFSIMGGFKGELPGSATIEGKTSSHPGRNAKRLSGLPDGKPMARATGAPAAPAT